MKGIEVSVESPGTNSRLLPRYDPETDFLVVTAESYGEWTYGVDIDGRIVFDLESSGKLVNFDCHIGKRRWKKGAVRQWPMQAATGSLIFSKKTIEHQSFSMDLDLTCDFSREILDIRINNETEDKAISLSRNCVAFVNGEQLVGFLIRGF